MATSPDVVVVGGGLAGLTCAGLLARLGAEVVLLERSQALGGRAQSDVKSGFTFNLGPHALYAHAPGMEALRALGVATPGGDPNRRRNHALYQGKIHRLPAGLGSLLTTSLLSARGRFEAMRALVAAQKADVQALAAESAEAWVRRQARDPAVVDLLTAVLRLSSYAHAPDLLSAGAALGNFQAASRGVLYLDGGWQALVDAVLGAAESFGARLRTGAVARRIVRAGQGWWVELDGADAIEAPAVVLALPPQAAAAVFPSEELRRHAEASIPIHVAAMDLGLSRLPVPEVKFVLGVDRPLYLSVQSDMAKGVAPEGGVMMQLARYLHPGERPDAASLERELEQLLDVAQPGWREVVRHRRFLPHLLVTPALVTAAGGGYAARPKVAAAERPGLFLAGDWVGPAGMLANASLHSAALAAEEAAALVRPAGAARRTA
ncbi:MAG TPA: FAD-dependent oxidoreductase [Myxococcaceae bacterium]|nr:FAD-dependent oxidoreductase [Myxococcaceae bacterium]